MIKTRRSSVIYPRYVVNSVLELEVKTLKDAGITHLVFDLDNTLVPKHGRALSPAFTNHLGQLRRAGFTLMLASNRRHHVSPIADALQAIPIRPRGLAYKPRRAYYQMVIAESGTSAKHLAMLGDHLINDVIGGNRAGLATILVTSLNTRPSAFKRLYVRHAIK